MSLLVTSSRQAEFDDVPVNGLEKPESYTNIMRSPFLVDAESEIAVVNIKCQRNGEYVVGNRGLTFGIYWGTELSNTQVLNSLQSDYADSILSKNRVVYVTIPEGSYSKEQFVITLNTEVNKICGQTFSNFGGATVTGIFDGTLNLTGLSFEFKQNASATNVATALSAQSVISTSNYIPANPLQESGYDNGGDLPYDLTDDFTYTFATKTLKKGGDATKVATAVFSKPLSSTSGVCEVDFQNVSGNFRIGLSRGFSGGTMPCPLNFNFNTQQADKDGNRYAEFYDYVFQMDRNGNNPADIKDFNVAQSYFNSANGGATTMSIFTSASYAGGAPPANGSFEGAIADDVRLCNIRFTRFGEKIKIEAFNKNADPSKVVTAVLADFNLASLCPVNLGNDQLYLKIELTDNGVATKDSVVVTRFDSNATNTADVGPNAPRNYGFDEVIPSSDTVREMVNEENEKVDWDVNDAFASLEYRDPIVYSVAPTYLDFNASFGQNRKWVLVLDQSNNEDRPSYQTLSVMMRSNVSKKLGFDKRIVKESVDKDASSTTNDIIFKGQRNGGLNGFQFASMFIRFHATQQQSYNANTGSISKIVYACPRFDVNGSLDGALYYEPNERVYIDMNNPSALTLTNMAIDIVDVNERLITDLEGQTQINFHIRKKSTGSART